jgi:hypothetical protein
MQQGSSASGTENITFGDGTTDTRTLQLAKEEDGVWRINGMTG